MSAPSEVRHPPAQAYSVREFCDSHGISLSMFHKLRNQGEGPRLMRVGRRVLISTAAAAAWRRKHEREPVRAKRHKERQAEHAAT
jgi:hypothetical protein